MELIKVDAQYPTQYDEARNALSCCYRIDEVKNVIDKHAALIEYARRAKDVEMEVWARGVRELAERRAGQLLIEMKERGERHTGHGDQKSESLTTIPIQTLSDMGVSPDQSSQWQKKARLTEAEFEAKQEGTIRNSRRAENSALPTQEAANLVVLFYPDAENSAQDTEIIKKHVHVAQNSGENEWYTPSLLIEMKERGERLTPENAILSLSHDKIKSCPRQPRGQAWRDAEGDGAECWR
jgi:hypothetical protein